MYTKVVICNGHKCDDALNEHVWVSELSISCQEAKFLEVLQHDLANPRIVQLIMLCFSAPTSLNNGLLNDRVVLEKYNEAVSLTILSTFARPFWRMNTPRSCFLRSIRSALINTSESLEPGKKYEGMGTG